MDGGRYTRPSPGESGQPLDEETLETFRQRLVYFAARRLWNRAEAEDVAQETIRRALEALRNGRVQDPKALPAFLFQTAVHVCQRRVRSAGREGRALRRLGAGQDVGPPNDPLAGLISAERRLSVQRAIAKLDEDDREILVLTYSEALQTAEIAEKLNLSLGNVRVRRHRALKRLAELLGVTASIKREP